MWQDFNAKLATLVNWKATLTQWEEKVLQLTHILIEHTYPKPVVPEPKKKKGNVAEESEDNKEKESEATTGGGDDKKRQSDRPLLTSSSSTGVSSTTSIRFVKHSHFHPPTRIALPFRPSGPCVSEAVLALVTMAGRGMRVSRP